MDFTIDNNIIWYGGTIENPLAYITFPEVEEGVVDITHTVVDPSLRGQGVAGKMTEALAEYLKAEGLKVQLTCSYAVKWFDKHEEYRDILKNNE